MSNTNTPPVHQVRHGEGELHAVMGDAMHFLITASESGGTYALSEDQVRPGSGSPPHIHHNEEESFYVLDGCLTITADGNRQIANKGDFVHVRRGIVRSFFNHTDQPATLLILHAPGSAADFYIGMGKLPVPPDMKDIIALGDKYGIEIVGPLGE